jgi:hypothetical protein
MKVANLSLDGGSLLTGLLIVVSATATIVSHLDGIRDAPLAVTIEILVLGSIVVLSLWQSIRIGTNREKLRDISRWMGETSNKTLIK